MLRLLKADLYRLTKSNNIKVMFILLTILSAFIVFSNSPVFVGVSAEQDIQQLEYLKNGAVEALDTATATIGIFLYISVIIYATIVGLEFKNSTYKNIIASGTSRISFVCAKVVGIIITLFIALTWFYLTAFIFGYIQYGFIQEMSIDFFKSFVLTFTYSLIVITVLFTLGFLLQLLFNNSIVSIVFIVIAPMLVQIITLITGSDYLTFIDLNSVSSLIFSGQLTNAEFIKWIILDFGIVAALLMLNSYLIKKKEF